MTALQSAFAAQRAAKTISAGAKAYQTVDFAKALAKERTAAVLPEIDTDSLSFDILPDGQSVSVSYTEDSTAEDPIVRVTGASLSGKFDFTCHINDIDTRNASYAELFALSQHQKHTQGVSSVQNLMRPYQTGAVSGDITQKRTDWSQLPAYPQIGSSGLLGSGLYGSDLFEATDLLGASTTDLLSMLQSSMLQRLQSSNLSDPSDMFSMLSSLPSIRFDI